MALRLDTDQRLLAETLREMFAEVHPHETVLTASEAPHDFDDAEVWRSLTEVGCPGLAVAADLGGAGGAIADLAVALEEAGYALLPGGLLASGGLGTALLGAVCDASETAGELLEAVATGQRRAAVALDADLAVSSSGPDRVVSGTLPLVLEAGVADVVLAVLEHLVVAVPTSRSGVTVEPAPTMDTSRRFHDVHLTDVRLESGDVLGEGPAAAHAVSILRDCGAVAVAADALGSAQRTLDDAVAYATTREQFGRPIGSFQAIKHLLVDTHVAVDAARSAVRHAATLLGGDTVGDGPDRRLAVHVAKALATDAGITAGANSLQVHGGIGFTREVTCHLHVKRARLNERLLGDAAAHRRAIAEMLQHDGLPDGW